MKRRNVECGKQRRPLKRNKITEGIYGGTFLYLKFLLLWALVLFADFILEFRFEFLWPFWLLLRSVYDSFKYQGLAFSMFFVCIALTSDMICFFFIPVHWLFFAASTYVWVQYVWHTEKGICVPTIILWLLFVYVEAAVRLKDLRHMPFHLDLCRPFAAHCIGYPVVTLGFGFKSYVGYRMRQRKQKEVSKENEFYMQLLQQALPQEESTQQSVTSQQLQQPLQLPSHNTSPEKSRGDTGISNGVAHIIPQTIQVNNSTTKNNHRKSLDKGERDKCTCGENETKLSVDKSAKYSHTNGSIHSDVDFIERLGSINDFNENEVQKDKNIKTCNVNPLKSNSSTKWNSNQSRDNSVNAQRENKKNKANRENLENSTPHNKEDTCSRLEADIKRLKMDLQSSRQIELELRDQISSLMTTEKNIKSELSQLQNDNDKLQSKLHGLVTVRQMDKQTISQLERRLQEERRIRTTVEAQLAAERKVKKAEEAAAARAVAIATVTKSDTCTESCRVRRRELESEGKQLRRELKSKDERYLSTEKELQSLRQYKESHTEAEILMSALSAMQDKNAHLENSLSAETRIKLDLFSALGEAKRQLELRDSLIREQGKEIEDLKLKFAQALATSDSFIQTVSAPSVIRSPKLVLTESPPPCSPCTVSNLDPNAMVYTPKGALVTSTEA